MRFGRCRTVARRLEALHVAVGMSTYLQRLESPERTVRDIGRSIVRCLDGGRWSARGYRTPALRAGGATPIHLGVAGVERATSAKRTIPYSRSAWGAGRGQPPPAVHQEQVSPVCDTRRRVS